MRCDFIFNNLPLDPMEIIETINSMINEFWKNNGLFPPESLNRLPVSEVEWTKPPLGEIKIK